MSITLALYVNKVDYYTWYQLAIIDLKKSDLCETGCDTLVESENVFVCQM